MRHAKKIFVAWVVALSLALPGPASAFKPILNLIKKFFQESGEHADFPEHLLFVFPSAKDSALRIYRQQQRECDPILDEEDADRTGGHLLPPECRIEIDDSRNVLSAPSQDFLEKSQLKLPDELRPFDLLPDE
ncbi:MAG: hypothetical protein OD918_08650 [Gammaproteobacteria bacterium]